MHISSNNSSILDAESAEDSLLPAKYYYKIQKLQQEFLISEGFSFLLRNSERIGFWINGVLEENNIFIGNGAFVLLKLEMETPYFPHGPKPEVMPVMQRKYPERNAIETFFEQVGQVLFPICHHYRFSDAGDIYALLCFRRETSPDLFSGEQIFPQLREAAEKLILTAVQLLDQAVSVRISNPHFSVRNISRAYRDICILCDYADFRSDTVPVLLMSDYGEIQNDPLRLGTQIKNVAAYLINALCGNIPEEIDAAVNASIEAVIQPFPNSLDNVRHRFAQLMQFFIEELEENRLIGNNFLQSYNMDALCHDWNTEDGLRDYFQEFLQAVQAQSQQVLAITSEVLKKVKQYIDENIISQELSVSLLADKFSVSRTILSTAFKNAFGIGLYKYIQTGRVSFAKLIIREHSELTMQSIANQSGFTNLSTMYRTFMRVEGYAPGTFRT